MDDDLGFLLLIFLVGIIPLVLGILQPILSVVYAIRRNKKGKNISGWKIYWLLATAFLAYYVIAPKYGMASIPDYFFLCYIPLLWFFFAGKFSDKISKKSAAL